jgi:hypothetical protein
MSVEQAAPSDFGKRIEPIAAAPTRQEHSLIIAVAEHKASSAVQRTSAPPRPALTASVAERRSDGSGVHGVAFGYSGVERTGRVSSARTHASRSSLS